MTTCVRCVRRCAKARGPISAIQPTNRLQTRASIEFSILAVFRFAWVQTCKPGTHRGSHLSHSPAFTHRPALTGQSARRPAPPGANRKPCKPYFLFGRWRNAALAPSVLEYRQEGPLLPGAYVRAPTITIGGDHHYRHNHHGSVTARDDGDGCDGRRLLFTQAKAQISPGGPTITLRRAPASTPGCHAGREVRARRRCDRGARRRTRGMGNASAARRAGRAS